MKFCPECGSALPSETAKFCGNCGSKIPDAPSTQQQPEKVQPMPQGIVQAAPVQPELAQPFREEKNPLLAFFCSLVVPGLGQVYNGMTARGIAILIGTAIGLFIVVIPGVVVWLYGMVDAYTTAKKMNDREIPFLPTSTAHLILFFILAGFVILAVLFIVVVMVLSVFLAPLAHASMTAPAGLR